MKSKYFAGRKNGDAFTLIEILLVITLIALLAGIVIVAVNPAKQLADGRNARRRADVNTIINAIYQFAIDKGRLPENLKASDDCASSGSNNICRTGATDCSGYTDLSDLTTNQTYLPAIPADPSVSDSYPYTGYLAVVNSNHRVIVCAPNAENGETISATR